MLIQKDQMYYVPSLRSGSQGKIEGGEKKRLTFSCFPFIFFFTLNIFASEPDLRLLRSRKLQSDQRRLIHFRKQILEKCLRI